MISVNFVLHIQYTNSNMQSILHKREIIEASNGLFIDFDLSWLHEGKIRLFGLSKDNVACQFSRYQSKILGYRI